VFSFCSLQCMLHANVQVSAVQAAPKAAPKDYEMDIVVSPPCMSWHLYYIAY
jgi:hypothetical protein